MLKKLAIGTIALVTGLVPFGGVAFAAAGPNLINNPSVETPTTGITVDGWGFNDGGATLTAASSIDAGHTGSRALKAEVTAYTSGTANWYHTAVPVVANTSYDVSVWYKSNVDVAVDIEYAVTGATAQNIGIGTATASADWKEFKTTIVTPANVSSAIIYLPLNKIGYVVTDDYSLATTDNTTTTTTFSEGMVSVTFDDGWKSQITDAWRIMQANGQKGTFYILTGSVDSDLYVSSDDIKALYAAGNEIGSHTIHHCDLAGANAQFATAECPIPITNDQVIQEMTQSKTFLENLIGGTVKNFAYPYGSYSANTIALGQQVGYTSQRSVEGGLNTKAGLDVTRLKIHEVQSNTTNEQVQTWINEAVTQKAWLILMYHDVANTPIEGNDLYTVTIDNFQAQMNALKSSNVKVVTVDQALAIANGTVTVKAGDVNGDSKVNNLDLTAVLANWGKTSATRLQGDVTSDGSVNNLDLTAVLANWSI